MKKIKFVCTITFSIILFTSCAKIVEEDIIWQPKALPVVFAIISPQHIVHVSLNKTVTLTEPIDSIIYPSAKVFVCGNDKNWIELSRESNGKATYTDEHHQMEIKEGEKYFLQIELPDDLLTAETTVPLQEASIIEAEYNIDNSSIGTGYYTGILNSKIKLAENYQCIMTANSFIIGNSNNTFLQNNIIAENLYLPDSISRFDIELITLDSYLSKYIVSQKINSRMYFQDGDYSIFIGAFNGVLPSYSNIKNGVGLFGSYVTTTKTVNITLP